MSLSSPTLDTTKESKKDIKRIGNSFIDLPINFIPNNGLVNDEVDFFAKGAGYSFYLTKTGVTYSFIREKKGDTAPGAYNAETPSLEGYALKVDFAGANRQPVVSGGDRLGGKVNYIYGNNADDWKTGIPTYGSVVYKDLYQGIDLIYKGDSRKIKYEYLVAPGSDPSNIKMIYQGAENLDVNESGDLTIATKWGNLKDEKPVVYQNIDGKRRYLKSSFNLSDNQVGFNVNGYDPKYSLVIDPGLDYSTFFGGTTGSQQVSDIIADSTGNAYIVGVTRSNDFPTTPFAFVPSYIAAEDGFITKFDPNGNSLVYSTFIGGSSDEAVSGIDLDSRGNAYITGFTRSFDFPDTTGPGGGGHDDAFVAKIDNTGGNLLFSRTFGGTDNDYGTGIKVNRYGQIFISGYTDSVNFPTTVDAADTIINANGTVSDPPNPNRTDSFFSRFNETGNQMLYSTFIGGDKSDEARDIGIDKNDRAYVTGFTKSSDFPLTSGAFDRIFDQNNAQDGFITIIRPNSQGPLDRVYSTFLGDNGDFDEINSIAVDPNGDAYVTGVTYLASFPTSPGAFDRTIGGNGDAFVFKLKPNGLGNSDMGYSTFLGGSAPDTGMDIVLDSQNNAYVTGFTTSGDYPSKPGAFDPTFNLGMDVFMSIVNSSGSDLIDSTFLGTTGIEFGLALDLDSRNNIYVSGGIEVDPQKTPSFPLVNPFSSTPNDIFVSKFQTSNNPYAGGFPELVINSLTASELNPDMGETVTVNLVVKNQGVVNSGPFDVDLHDNPLPEPPPTGQVGSEYQTVADLAPGAETTVTFEVVWPVGGIHKLYGSADTISNVIESNENNNIFGPVNVLVGKPDLLIDNLSVSNLTPDINEIVNVSMVLKNQGESEAGPFDVELYDNPAPDPPLPGQPGAQTLNVAGLAKDATVAVNFSISWPVNSAHKLMGQVDVNGSIPELDELNNLSSSTTVNVLSLPDLIVQSVTPSNFLPSTGELINIDVVVKNRGSAASAPSNVVLFDNPVPEPPSAGQAGGISQLLAGLAPNATATLTFNVSWPINGSHKLYALADRDSVIPESNETNNGGGPAVVNVNSNVASILAWDSGLNNWNWEASKVTSGDFNGDGRTDIAVMYGYINEREVKIWVFKGNVNGFNAPTVWWASGPGNWDWAGSMLTSGDYTGDGVDDIGVLYGYSTERDVRAFIFPSTTSSFSASQIWFHAGQNNWDWAGSKLTTGDFDGDGIDDFGVLYGYFVQRDVRIFTFLSTGSSFGKNPPFISEEWFHAGSGNWDWVGSLVTAGDYNGDGRDDFGVLYGYAVERDVRSFVFPSTGTKFSASEIWFHAGPNNWDWAGSKLLSGEFTGDAADEMVVFYGYAGARSAIFVFPSNLVLFTSSVVWYDSGPGNFAWDATKPLSGNFDGIGIDDVAGFYNYGNSHSAIFLFK